MLDPKQNENKSLKPVIDDAAPYKKYLNTVFKGIVMLLPVMILLVIFVFLFRLMLSMLTPIAVILTGGGELWWFVYILSFLILLVIFYSAGLFVSSRIGNMYFNEFEKAFLYQIPLYSTFRETIQQFTGAKELPFQRVALVDVFNTGTMMTSFVIQRVAEELYTVYVPTAPNPANGNIYHVKREQLVFVDVKLEAALRSVVSMGVGSKQLFDNIQQSPTEDGKMTL